MAKQAPGVPRAHGTGAGTVSSWSSSEQTLSHHPASFRASALTSCGPICVGRTVLPQCRQLQGRRRSQRDVRCHLQALSPGPFLGAAAALVCAPVRVVPQVCSGQSTGAA